MLDGGLNCLPGCHLTGTPAMDPVFSRDAHLVELLCELVDSLIDD